VIDWGIKVGSDCAHYFTTMGDKEKNGETPAVKEGGSAVSSLLASAVGGGGFAKPQPTAAGEKTEAKETKDQKLDPVALAAAAALGSSTAEKKEPNKKGADKTKKRKLEKEEQTPNLQAVNKKASSGSASSAGSNASAFRGTASSSQAQPENVWTDERKLMLARETCLQKPYRDKSVWLKISDCLKSNNCFQGVDPEYLSAKEVQATFRQLMIDFEEIRGYGVNPAMLQPVKKTLFEFLEKTRGDMLELLQHSRPGEDQSAALAAGALGGQLGMQDAQMRALQQQLLQGGGQGLQGLGSTDQERMMNMQLLLQQQQQQQQLQQQLQQQQQQQQQQHQQQSQQQNLQRQQQIKEIETQQMLLVQQHLKNMQSATSVAEQYAALQNYQNISQKLDQTLAELKSVGGNGGDQNAGFANLANGAGGSQASQQQQMLLQQMLNQRQQQQASVQKEQQQKMAQQQLLQQQQQSNDDQNSKSKPENRSIQAEEVQQKYNEMASSLGADNNVSADVLAKLLMAYNEKKRQEIEELNILQSNPSLLELALMREQNQKFSLGLQLQRQQQQQQQ